MRKVTFFRQIQLSFNQEACLDYTVCRNTLQAKRLKKQVLTMKLFHYIEQQIKYLLFSVLKLRCRGRRGHISPGTDFLKLLLYQNIVQANLSLLWAVSLVHKKYTWCIAYRLEELWFLQSFKHLKMFCCLNFLRAIYFPLMSVSGFCAQLSNCVCGVLYFQHVNV